MAQVPVILSRLFNKKKDWEYCTISIAGRGPVAVHPDTNIALSDDGRILKIIDPEAPNPFFRGAPGEPETVSLEENIDTDYISSVGFLKFPKILTKPSKIIT